MLVLRHLECAHYNFVQILPLPWLFFAKVPSFSLAVPKKHYGFVLLRRQVSLCSFEFVKKYFPKLRMIGFKTDMSHTTNVLFNGGNLSKLQSQTMQLILVSVKIKVK